VAIQKSRPLALGLGVAACALLLCAVLVPACRPTLIIASVMCSVVSVALRPVGPAQSKKRTLVSALTAVAVVAAVCYLLFAG